MEVSKQYTLADLKSTIGIHEYSHRLGEHEPHYRESQPLTIATVQSACLPW